jgi:hypothetical protein
LGGAGGAGGAGGKGGIRGVGGVGGTTGVPAVFATDAAGRGGNGGNGGHGSGGGGGSGGSSFGIYASGLASPNYCDMAANNNINGGAGGAGGSGGLSLVNPGGAGEAGVVAAYSFDGLTHVPAPTITAVNPNAGSADGGVAVTITGLNLCGATTVTFGGAASTITAQTSTSITVTTPAQAAGAVDVVVTTTNGTATAAAGFTYFICNYSLPSSSMSAPSGGMLASFNVIAPAGCPWTATSDSAWLTTSSAGSGNGSVSYTVAANTSTVGRSGTITVGGQPFTVTQSGAMPLNLSATGSSTPSVSVIWTSTAVDHFEIYRNSGSGFVLLSSPAASPFTDNAVSPNSAYMYKVRAFDSGGNPSAFSNSDLATTIAFTDDPLIAGSTIIKAAHLMQLRQAVNAVRGVAGLMPYTFTDPSLAGVAIRLIHLTELRAALDPALSQLGLAPVSYSTTSVGSPVNAIDLMQIRNAVK